MRCVRVRWAADLGSSSALVGLLYDLAESVQFRLRCNQEMYLSFWNWFFILSMILFLHFAKGRNDSLTSQEIKRQARKEEENHWWQLQ